MTYKKCLKRGVTIVELVIVITIVGILTSISVVGYSSYIGNARKVAMKNHLASLHQGYQSLGGRSGNYCLDVSDSVGASHGCDVMGSLYNVGMENLIMGRNYGVNADKKPNFIGFGRVVSTCDNINAFTTYSPLHVKDAHTEHTVGSSCATVGRRSIISIGASSTNGLPARDLSCFLDRSSYKIGAFGFYKGKTWIGMNINQNGFFQVRDDENTGVAPPNVIIDRASGNAPCDN